MPVDPTVSGAAITAIGEQPSAVRRAGRIFIERLDGRATLVAVLLVALAVGVTIAAIRSGVSLGGITGRESTDDAYVRADQITIASHIAGYVESVPVRDNETVKQGQLVATIRDDDYRAKVASAEAALETVQSQKIVGASAVRAAEAALALARIDLGYTRIVSPANGQLSDRGTLPGEFVSSGTRVGLVVALPNVWVVANFRESQLARMHPGQSATVSVDSAPGIKFSGTVDSIGPASGALQALLPPDNATGNFTKVTQRFAVKVTLAPGQANIDRLRPGMSAIVTVAVGGTRPQSAAP
jgi:multidrug resistance efflux pump